MSTLTVAQRIQALQRRLDLRPDGVIGPVTLTRLEETMSECLPAQGPSVPEMPPANLTVSRRGLDLIVSHEIGSAANYNRSLQNPIWPGGQSGVTIGIGYDLGYNSVAQIERDWRGRISDAHLAQLVGVAGLKGETARQARTRVRSVVVLFEAARQVFYTETLPRFARMTRQTYPGVEHLPADAQAGLLSLVYNRGASLSGSTRREMLAIRDLVARGDLLGIAAQIRSMKRLWEGKGLPGLLRRRDEEAALVAGARRTYAPDELVRV
jgi:hypothetical protein